MTNYIKLIGIILMMAFMLTWGMVFIKAYENPGKIVEVSINDIGEANLELALLAIVVPLSIYVAVDEVLPKEERPEAWS